MAKGTVFDIQRFSVHDGPGIRTTVFLKGCPLSCQWCHNPEGRSADIQMRFFEEKCLGCGMCKTITGLKPMAISGKVAGEQEIQAADNCPTGALSVCGRRYQPEEMLEIIKRDRDFYGNCGGVTFSGGEPTMQPEFLKEILALCQHNGIHTALDTCGYAATEVYESVLPFCDLVLFDIKGMNSNTHRQYTGMSNEIILNNFQYIAKTGTPIWVRVPLIHGLTADKDALYEIMEFLKPYNDAIQQVTLIPYHSFGNSKYKTLGMQAKEFMELSNEQIQDFEKIVTNILGHKQY